MGVADRLARLAPPDRAAVEWLLVADEPAVRRLALTEVLGLPAGDAQVIETARHVLDGPLVRGLLAGQQSDGGFGASAYAKWNGTHWRLLALTELCVPADSRMLAALEHELAWVRSAGRIHRGGPLEGRFRRCASQEGAALAIAVHLARAGDDRVAAVARSLVEWQWPDGGWNCDVRPQARHSSFHESLKPLWGLAWYARSTGDRIAKAAVERAGEFFLSHQLYRSHRTGAADPRLLRFRFPAYWHYDALDGLLVMARAGYIDDPRTADALDEVEARRMPDGRWRTEGRWWRPPGSSRAAEAVDWGDGRPSPFITLNALRVLRAAGRLSA